MTNNIKQALQSSIEQLEISWKICCDEDYLDGFINAANECKSALSEIEKYEPVGEVVMVQEPEWIKPHEGFKWYQTEFPLGTKFYTSPISKEWVGLSYEEVESLYDGGSWHEFANAISEKLKQLNTKG